MEGGIDFVTVFDVDITSSILELLSDPCDLLRASAVSRAWHHFLIANGLCKKLWLRKVPQVTYIAYSVKKIDGKNKLVNVASKNTVNWSSSLGKERKLVFTLYHPIPHNGINKLINVTSKNHNFNWGNLDMEHKLFSSLLHTLSKPITSPKFIMSFRVGASSTDQNPPVTIINTLTPELYSFWSSKGQNDPNAPEYLLYKLMTSVSIVTEVHIQPLEVFWETGKPVYSARSVRFRLGHSKLLSEADIDTFLINRPSLDKYVWTYASPWFPMRQESCLQTFKLPEPVVCVNGVFLIELLGRAQKDIDGLYYIRLGYAKIMGQTLDTAFHTDVHPSGEVQLDYYPHSAGSGLRSFSSKNKEDTVRENEELCMGMARGLLDFLDDEDEEEEEEEN
ncbi:F-box protein [Striga hermonthica]|uniref:F-box protein n=1 Tax=Striga hermonthica TaxID=68872 RepID=A0A9N7NTK3_STRHE|nr:F-box protein [Striga hermonthica]